MFYLSAFGKLTRSSSPLALDELGTAAPGALELVKDRGRSAVALELVVARKERDAALRAGLGTVAGLVAATAAKAVLIAVMLGIAVLTWLV